MTFDKEETIRGILTYAGDGGRVTKYHVQFWNSQTYQFEDIAVSFIGRPVINKSINYHITPIITCIRNSVQTKASRLVVLIIL